MTTSPNDIELFGVEITGALVFKGVVVSAAVSTIETLPFPKDGARVTSGEVAPAAMKEPPPVPNSPVFSLLYPPEPPAQPPPPPPPNAPADPPPPKPPTYVPIPTVVGIPPLTNADPGIVAASVKNPAPLVVTRLR